MTDSNEPPDGSTPDPVTRGLPGFPGATNEPPPRDLPQRSWTWARNGAIAGGVLGLLFGLFIVGTTLATGQPPGADALIFLVVIPIVFAVSGGVGWAFRGMIADSIMARKDDERRRELERKDEENAAWRGVDEIMRRRRKSE